MKIDFDDFLLIAGPCVVESEEHLRSVAATIKDWADMYGVQWVLKSSWDKANRSSVFSFRGADNAGEILQRVGEIFQVPITSDVHEVAQAHNWGRILDIIQIPAMLSRQTDLIQTAAQHGRPVNIKKGQTISPGAVEQMCAKVWTVDQKVPIIITERGSQFGYGDTVVDFRRFTERPRSYMHCLDVTHTVNDWKDSFVLMRAAVACGVRIIFVEMGSTKCDADRAIPKGHIGTFIAELSREIKSKKARGW